MRVLWIGICLLLLGACADRPGWPSQYPEPSEAEVVQALRDALALCAVRAIARASKADGFYTDSRLRLGFPDNTRTMQTRLFQAGLARQMDRNIEQINQVAEAAAARAKPVLIRAITGLDMDDPFELLLAREPVATDYLVEQALEEMYAGMQPLVIEALEESSAEQFYRRLVERHNAMPMSYDVEPVLAEHISEKTIDGLLLLMAEEESRLRSTPSARGTQQINRVFRALD